MRVIWLTPVLLSESQVLNFAKANLAMGHEILQLVESSEVAYSVAVDPEVACFHHQPRYAAQQELAEVSVVVVCLLEQVGKVLVVISAGGWSPSPCCS